MSTPLSRRDFLATASAAMAAGGAALGQDGKPQRVRRAGMVYRRLGRTGLMVSEISLGGSPAPNEAVFARAIERGINFADTSETYSNGNSERTIGKMMKGRRDKFYVATKCHPRKLRPLTRDGIIGMAEASLKRLDTDYIDIYLIHGAGKPEQLSDEIVLEAFAKLKKDGKIRFTGASLHGKVADMAKVLIESGRFDMCNIPYNVYQRVKSEKGKKYDDYLQRTGIEDALALAKKRDIGVVAMKSMGGGEFQKVDKYLTGKTTLPQAKLKWVLENDAVGTIVSELLSFQILEENLAVVGSGLTRDERKTLYRYAEATSAWHCRLCGACEAQCPAGVATTTIQRLLAYHDGYGKRASSRRAYAALPPQRRAAACRDCGRCESVCTFGVAVRARLRRAGKVLT